MFQEKTLQIYFELKKEFQRRLFLFFVVFFLYNSLLYSQDSIPDKDEVAEQKALKFQEFFFKALSEKSIENYQRAIENLESCNQILDNQVAVFFEFSKNYLALNNTVLAKEYIQRALQNEPENLWMLKHLVAVFEKETNFEEAIKIQKKIVQLNAKEQEYLLRLYVLNNQLNDALALLAALEKETGLSSEFSLLKDTLKNTKVLDKNEVKRNDLENLKLQFETDKSFTILEQILQKAENNFDDLWKFGKEGIILFPEQPFVYLQYGKALNHQKEYQKALHSLENGLDFVIDKALEIEFYTEIAKAYKGLENHIEEKKYLQKATILKQKI